MPDFSASPYVLPPLQQRSRAALEKIVRAAAEVIAAKGAEGFSMADVAIAANLPVGNIYRRFRGKEELIQALKLDASSRIESAISARLGSRSFTDIGQLVSCYALATAEAFAKDEALHRFLFSQPAEREKLKAIGKAARHRIFDMYKAGLLPLLGSISPSRRDLAVVVSFHIIASAFLTKARGESASLNALSWKGAAKEFGRAAVCYLEANTG
jgi:AcrR family transcriptional regulator